MTQALARAVDRAELIERVVIIGDLAKLTPQERVSHYVAVCDSLGLNPLTRPFDYIKNAKGELVIYPNKGCTDQLRNNQKIDVRIVAREHDEALGLYTVTARAKKPNGREDEDVGSVPVKGLSGGDLANATMKAHTKAKRRVTLSICGLGNMIDESELDSVRGWQPVRVDYETGEVLEQTSVSTYRTPHDEPTTVYHTADEANSALYNIEQAQTREELMAARPYTTPAEYDTWSPEDRRRLNKSFKARERVIANLEAQAKMATDPEAEDL